MPFLYSHGLYFPLKTGLVISTYATLTNLCIMLSCHAKVCMNLCTCITCLSVCISVLCALLPLSVLVSFHKENSTFPCYITGPIRKVKETRKWEKSNNISVT